jgi:hypothetical protein
MKVTMQTVSVAMTKIVRQDNDKDNEDAMIKIVRKDNDKNNEEGQVEK